jgi:hypothetical protein
MGIPVMVLGESGTGKSASLRNLDPETTFLIQAVSKPLPFRNSWQPTTKENPKGSIFVCDNASTICKAMVAAAANGKTQIIIDDFQYVMANEFMRRSGETGFGKFTEIAKHAWDVVMSAQQLPTNVTLYVLSHTVTTDQGRTKAKTIGKLLDEKITLEGLFSIVMGTVVDDGSYYFSTQNSGFDTVKTPMEMFDNKLIENDLALVDQTIKSYFGV